MRAALRSTPCRVKIKMPFCDRSSPGKTDLGGVPAAVFFDTLLKMSIEGFFCDPVYGGNRDMVAWRMIGFPGAYADYFEAVDRQGMKFEREPMGLAEHAHHRIPRQNMP
jgi:gluconate 2-dehydrogenase gamma chain